MAYTIYTGSFEQTENTFLRLCANPYRIIISVTKDGSTIYPVAGTTVSPTLSDCLNYIDGIKEGSYDLGKLRTASSNVNVMTGPYQYSVTYHDYTGPSTVPTDTQDQYYGEPFQLHSTSSVQGYVFDGWAVGASNSTVIIPTNVTTAVLSEIDDTNATPASLMIPTLYTTPSTTLHLYALWRPCNSVAVTVTVTDGSPLTSTITVNN